MNEAREISFEELNAFIDGELDAGAAARVLTAIDADEQLRREACELRAQRDQVRNAYDLNRFAITRPPRRFGVTRWPQALAASLIFAVGALAGWAGHAWRHADPEESSWTRLAQVKMQGDARRLVLHVGDPDFARFETTLDEVRGLLKSAHDRGQRMELEILANGAGLNLLRASTTPFAERLAQLQAEFPELSLVACGQGLNRLQGRGDDIRLIPGVATTDSALDEIVRRMNEGWAYLRV